MGGNTLWEPQATSTQILQKVNQQDIDNALTNDLRSCSVGGAHWFRIADLWFKINHGYNNPHNLGSVNSELLLVEELGPSLSCLLAGRRLVFFGVGVGDTESAFVDLQLDAVKASEMVLIDINPVFLRFFVSSLAARKLELSDATIRYRAINGFFEHLSTDALLDNDNKETKVALICLGGTVGNYSNSCEIFDLFHGLMRPGDRIFLGYQLNTHFPLIFQKYFENELYRELIGNFMEPSQRKQIKWSPNHDESMVEAWLNNIQIFRSKKFSTESTRALAESYGWHELLCGIDRQENQCIHVFQYK